MLMLLGKSLARGTVLDGEKKLVSVSDSRSDPGLGSCLDPGLDPGLDSGLESGLVSHDSSQSKVH